MNDEELEKLIKFDMPKTPYIECNSKKILQKCKIQKDKYSNQIFKYLFTVCFCIVLCFATSFLTIRIVNNNYSSALNVDKGKSPYLAMEGFSQELYEAIKANNPDWEPKFDNLIAFGPESASGTIKLEVINKSNLLSDKSKQILAEYETSIKKTYPSHAVSFQIAFGTKNNVDYIYLIDYCGYDNNLGKEVRNEFLFESNLNYSFDSIVNEFELQIGKELTDEFLNSAYYDDQNLLSSGIVIGFIEVDGLYQEYYIVKLDGEIFVINK